MGRYGTKPYVFVLNNDGYTIERLIHGETALYNDIQPWDHLKLLDTFKAAGSELKRVATAGELNALFGDAQFAKNDRLRLTEIMLAKMDAPQSLVQQAERSASTNLKA